MEVKIDLEKSFEEHVIKKTEKCLGVVCQAFSVKMVLSKSHHYRKAKVFYLFQSVIFG